LVNVANLDHKSRLTQVKIPIIIPRISVSSTKRALLSLYTG